MPHDNNRYNRMRRQARRDRNQDFRLTEDINSAIYANLLRKTKRGKARLTSSNRRVLDKMDRMLSRMASAGSSQLKQFKAPGGDLGALLGMAVSSARSDVEATQKSGKRTAKAGRQLGAAYADTGNLLMNMAKQGVKESRQSAKSAAADALSVRAGEDATMIAEMAQQEHMLRLQHKFAMEEAEAAAAAQIKATRQAANLEARKASKAIGGQVFGAMRPMADMLASAAPRILTMLNDDMSAEDIVARLEEQGVVTAAGGVDGQAMLMLVRSLSNNTQAGPDDIAEEALSVMLRVPQWAQVINQSPKARKRLSKFLSKLLSSAQADYEAGQFSSTDSSDSGFEYSTPRGFDFNSPLNPLD